MKKVLIKTFRTFLQACLGICTIEIFADPNIKRIILEILLTSLACFLMNTITYIQEEYEVD
jgi:hypothetical protein